MGERRQQAGRPHLGPFGRRPVRPRKGLRTWTFRADLFRSGFDSRTIPRRESQARAARPRFRKAGSAPTRNSTRPASKMPGKSSWSGTSTRQPTLGPLGACPGNRDGRDYPDTHLGRGKSNVLGSDQPVTWRHPPFARTEKGRPTGASREATVPVSRGAWLPGAICTSIESSRRQVLKGAGRADGDTDLGEGRRDGLRSVQVRDAGPEPRMAPQGASEALQLDPVSAGQDEPSIRVAQEVRRQRAAEVAASADQQHLGPGHPRSERGTSATRPTDSGRTGATGWNHRIARSRSSRSACSSATARRPRTRSAAASPRSAVAGRGTGTRRRQGGNGSTLPCSLFGAPVRGCGHANG
jgi:hypothetical protein